MHRSASDCYPWNTRPEPLQTHANDSSQTQAKLGTRIKGNLKTGLNDKNSMLNSSPKDHEEKSMIELHEKIEEMKQEMKEVGNFKSWV
jgi:hypothetical protein